MLIFSWGVRLIIEEPDSDCVSILFKALNGDSPGRIGGRICQFSVRIGIKPAFTKLDLPEPEAPKTTVRGCSVTIFPNC